MNLPGLEKSVPISEKKNIGIITSKLHQMIDFHLQEAGI